MNKQPIILSQRKQEELIKEIIKSNIIAPCDKNVVNHIQPQVSKMNVGVVKNLQDQYFYDEKVQEGIRCTFNALVNDTNGLLGQQRFFTLLGKMKKLGEGVNGVVMSLDKSGKTNEDFSADLKNPQNLSRHGNFSLFDSEGLVVAKFSKRSSDEEVLREFVIGNILNTLREFIPNFSQVYGLVGCDKIFENDFFCSDKGSNSVLIMEKIKGTSFENWLKRAEDTGENRRNLINIIFQIFHALWYAHSKFSFTHNDLHGQNIIIRELNEEHYLPYYYSDEPCIFLKTKFIPTIIDYGYSRLVMDVPPYLLDRIDVDSSVTNISIGTRNFDRYREERGSYMNSLGPQQSHPLFDIFRVLMTVLPVVREKPILLGVFQSMMDFFPHKYHITNERELLYWSNRFYSLDKEQLEDLSRENITVASILQQFISEYSKTYPKDCIMIQSERDMNRIEKQVPIMSCSAYLIQKLREHPILSKHANQLNITCHFHNTYEEMGVSPSAPLNFLDLSNLYDYIILTGVKRLEVADLQILDRAIQVAVQHLNYFNQPTIQDDINRLYKNLESSTVRHLSADALRFLDDLYKNINIGQLNLKIIFELSSRGLYIMEKELNHYYKKFTLSLQNLLKIMSEITTRYFTGNFYSSDVRNKLENLMNALKKKV